MSPCAIRLVVQKSTCVGPDFSKIVAALKPMPRQFSTIQKCAFGFAALFLFVYLLDYVPGVMDANGKMFGLFGMTRIVDIGHLTLGAMALGAGFWSADISRVYFWILGFWYAI